MHHRLLFLLFLFFRFPSLLPFFPLVFSSLGARLLTSPKPPTAGLQDSYDVTVAACAGL
jgi:hypothetical protein